MKKIFFTLTFGILILLGCNNSKENAEGGNKSNDTAALSNIQNSEDEGSGGALAKCSGISLDVLKKMIEYWQSLPHPDSTIIRQISMDGKTLRSLLNKVDEFKLFTGAYLEDKGAYKKGETTIIVGLNKGEDWTFCDIRDIFYVSPTRSAERSRKPICPPPEPCGVPFMEEARNQKL